MATMRRILLVLGCCYASAVFAQEPPPSEPPTAEQIKQWVQELGAEQYFVRDAAMKNLISAGSAAVEPLAESLTGNGLEVTARAVFVLQELALSGDPGTEDAARDVLARVAALRITAAARRAQVALDKLDQIRQERALDHFRRLGARIERQHIEMGLPDLGGVGMFAIEFGAEWRGEEKDLARLKWLPDVEQVTFEGRHVNQNWVQYVRGMSGLSVVKIKRAGITDDSLVHLTELERLQYIKLLYVPITDESIKHLQQCRQVSKIMLFGTRMTKQGADKLQESLVGEVDFRQGAFLGISPSNLGENWAIASVTANSAADKAGLQPGDRIITYDDRPVGDFNSLTGLISRPNAGDTVRLEIRRGSEHLVREITLGEWN